MNGDWREQRAEPAFYRSSDDRVLGGVCGGLAHKWGLSSAGLRVAAVILALFTWAPVIAYIVLWLVLPERPTRLPE